MQSLTHKSHLSVKLITLSLLLLPFTPFSLAFADNNGSEPQPSPVQIQISPGREKIEIAPETTSEHKFTVTNLSDKATQYRVYTTPYSALNADGALGFEEETKYTQLSNWVTVKDKNGKYVKEASFSIDPQESQEVEYRVSCPEKKKIPDGSQHATIFAESISDDKSKDGIKTISRVGVVLEGSGYGNTIKTSEITRFTQDNFLFEGNIRADATLKNTGNVENYAKLKMTIKNLFGATVFTDDNTTAVLPETERNLSIEWEETPWVGLFNVTTEFSSSDNRDVRADMVLILPVALIVIQSVLLVAVIIWLIIIIKKKRAHRIKGLKPNRKHRLFTKTQA